MRSHLAALAVTLGLASSIAVAGPAAVGSSGGGSSSGGSVSSGGGGAGGGGGGHSGGGGGGGAAHGGGGASGGAWHGGAGGANGGGYHGGANGGGWHNGASSPTRVGGGAAPGRTPGSYQGDGSSGFAAGAHPGHGIYNYHGSRGGYSIVGAGSTGLSHGSSETISDHSAWSTLAVGPQTGSAAKAALVTNQHSPHHPGTPGQPGHHPKHSNPAVEYRRQDLYASQQPRFYPQFCPSTGPYDNTATPVLFGCPPPVKLKTKGLPGT